MENENAPIENSDDDKSYFDEQVMIALNYVEAFLTADDETLDAIQSVHSADDLNLGLLLLTSVYAGQLGQKDGFNPVRTIQNTRTEFIKKTFL